MDRICRLSGESFTIRPEDELFYKKIGVPFPTLSPDERARRRWAFRNERSLYEGTCDLCEKKMITIYSSDKPYTVYCQDCWWGDGWKADDFSASFDFSRPFFEQFSELLLKVPRSAIYNVKSTNSDYCQQVYSNKDCYFCSVIKGCEGCRYISHGIENRDCLDSTMVHKSELCYECVDGEKLYNCFYSLNCNNSNDLYFSYDCNGCSDCFGCVGLRNKQYYIANKPYSKEEYFKRLESFGLGKWSAVQRMWEEFKSFRLTFPHRATLNIATEHSTGNHLHNAKNVYQCFDSFDIEDCAYCIWIFRMKDSYDCYGVGDSELIYEGVGVEEVNRCFFNSLVTGCNDVHYSDSCFGSSNLYGCVGIRKGEYMILNKQYSKEEYETLMLKIIDHMKTTGEYGEFFPKSLSPFAYNETLAQEKFPLSKEAVLAQGLQWKEKDLKEYQKQTYELADDVKDESDEVTKALLACTDCGRNYNILAQDLAFYRKKRMPIPRHCVFCRHNRRMNLRMPYSLNQRVCEKCDVSLQTPYSKESLEKVVCESCYLGLVY
jgi:hypothetical protein